MARRPSFTAHHRTGSGTPVVLLHGFTDTWRTWDLVIPHLQDDHDVLAHTLVGHAGGAPAPDDDDDDALADDVERAMDAAGFDTAHIVGNSLGGYVAMHVAARGRARSVTAFAPAGGWPAGDPSFEFASRLFERMQRDLVLGAHLLPRLSRARLARRYATRHIVERADLIPRDLLAHMAWGARLCPVAPELLRRRHEFAWHVEPDRIDCPVRIVWGTRDRVLLHPVAASAYRDWFPNADWVELDGVGHCPQLEVPERVAELVRAQVGRVEQDAAG